MEQSGSWLSDYLYFRVKHTGPDVFITLIYEDMERFFRNFHPNKHDIKNLNDLIKFTEETPAEEASRWGMEEWHAAAKAAEEPGVDSEAHLASSASRRRMGGEIEKLLELYHCDILVAPSWTETTANIGGCPQISVPWDFIRRDGRLKEALVA